MNIWKNMMIFRDAEGEGAGGASGGHTGPAGEGAQPAPVNPDQLSALEQRLARIATSVEGLTQQQKREKSVGAIQQREAELQKAVTDQDSAIASAESALATAYDDGDGVEIAKAQRALSAAVAKRERADANLEAFKQHVQEVQEKASTQGRQSDLDTKNLNAWKDKNKDWYGVDAEMTKASHEIDRQIRELGVLSVGTEEYFKAIDKQMAQKFPDRFGGTPPTSNAPSGQPSTPQRRGGRIAQSIADGWRRMGINVDDPETVKRMVANREKAVQKGILPETPVTGPVITR